MIHRSHGITRGSRPFDVRRLQHLLRFAPGCGRLENIVKKNVSREPLVG